MIIKMDSNEYALHPQIVESIKKNLQKRAEKDPNYEMFSENSVIPQKLECGDYMYNNVLIEHMVLPDFCGKVINGNIFRQAQDMLYTKDKLRETGVDFYPYIIISGDIADVLVLPNKPNPSSMIAAWSSLNRIGVPTSFVGNQWFFIEGMIDLFEKHYDGKLREYNPVRKPVELRDEILSNYCSIPEISEERAKKLQAKFPTPKDLYNATKEQLYEVDLIGKKTSESMIEFFNGLRPKEVGKIGVETIWEIVCRGCGKTMNTVDKKKRYHTNCEPNEYIKQNR
jgi:ERCC4-type nuclease